MRELLFVDDDAGIVGALANVVRRNRNRWRVRFAASADEAMREMRHTPADVVVTDMQMPGGDGATLLAQIQQAWPATVRIVLSGELSDGVGRSLTNVAHQFLTKPIESMVLLTTLDRTCAVLDRLQSAELRSMIGMLGKLPVLSREAQALHRILASRAPTTREIANAVEASPALAAKVLHLGNSTFFAAARAASSVERAIAIVGHETLRSLVLAAELFSVVPDNSEVRDVHVRVQERALFSARLVHALASRSVSATRAWTAALLHDIGLIVILGGKPSMIRDVEEHMRTTGDDLATASRALWGATHAEVSAYLLGLWGFDWEVIDAVSSDRPALGEELTDVRSIAGIASALADERYPLFAEVPEWQGHGGLRAITPHNSALRAEWMQIALTLQQQTEENTHGSIRV